MIKNMLKIILDAAEQAQRLSSVWRGGLLGRLEVHHSVRRRPTSTCSLYFRLCCYCLNLKKTIHS